MKLYYHPVSTTCRPIMMLAAESGLALDYQVVDLFKGEHVQPPFAAINPSKCVPVLEDGDFRLTESSAILKYLADKASSPLYPTDPKLRAKVNSMMDWFNTGFYRDFGYGLLYPQLMPHLKRPDERDQASALAWGRDRTKEWLTILDRDLIGADKRWLVGDQPTIADLFGASMLTAGEVIRLDYGAYPNIRRWLDNVKALPTWKATNEAFYAHFVAPFKDAPFVGL